jgi:uncharacterized protein
MKPSELLELHREEIREVVAAHGHSNPRVFGSVARGEDDEISDLDFLVELDPGTSGFDFGDLYGELSELLGIEIHLLTPGSLPAKFRDRVLKEAVAV